MKVLFGDGHLSEANLDTIRKIAECQDSNELLDWSAKHLIHYHAYNPRIITGGKGVLLKDIDGKEFIDFAAMVAAVNIGYGDKEVVEAIRQQLDQIAPITTNFLNIPQVRLARLLAEVAPELPRCFFATSGSEATELAIKTVRRHTGRRKIISRWGGYHGWTGSSLSASGAALYKREYDPMAPGFVHVPPPYCYRCDFGKQYPDCKLECAQIVESAIIYEHPSTVAAVIAEPIIGGGGAIVPPDGYLHELRRICSKYDLQLIIDEVITGFGRTGKMFAYQTFGVTPDLLTVAKGIASTYIALSAVLTNDTIARGLEDYGKGESFSTYGNHPVACAAAVANIKAILERKLPENAARMGDYCLKALKDIAKDSPILGEARGKGLLLGVEIVKNKNTKETDIELGRRIARTSLGKGLFFGLSRLRVKNAVIAIFSPPLTITREEIDKALEIFQSAVKEASIGL